MPIPEEFSGGGAISCQELGRSLKCRQQRKRKSQVQPSSSSLQRRRRSRNPALRPQSRLRIIRDRSPSLPLLPNRSPSNLPRESLLSQRSRLFNSENTNSKPAISSSIRPTGWDGYRSSRNRKLPGSSLSFSSSPLTRTK